MTKRIIDGKLYNTESAVLIGTTKRHERNWSTRWRELYKTKKGAFFSVHYSQWQGEADDYITVLDESEAKELYEGIDKPKETWRDTFGSEPEEA